MRKRNITANELHDFSYFECHNNWVSALKGKSIDGRQSNQKQNTRLFQAIKGSPRKRHINLVRFKWIFQVLYHLQHVL